MKPNQQRPDRQRHRKGFTLIEVIVAIAVIAALAVITMSAISRVKAHSEQSKCAANLRQLGQAFITYGVEHNNTLLATSNNDRSLTAGSSWSIMLMNYLDLRFPRLNEESLFLCPSAYTTYPNGNAKRTYAMNYQNLPTEGSGIHPTRGWEQQTRFEWHSNPAQTVLLIDSMGTVSAAGDGAMNFTLNTIENVADWRHSGGLNALFLDGHVSLFHRNESEQLNSYVNNFAR